MITARATTTHYVIAWNTIIRSHVRLGDHETALSVYLRMIRAAHVPDSYTLPLALKASAALYDSSFSRQLHSTASKLGLSSHEFVESALISSYAKLGHLDFASQLFDENPRPRLGSFNALISGFAQVGRSKDAILTFVRLVNRGLTPDDVTMVSVASACGGLGDLDLASQVHKWVIRLRPTTYLSNSLVDMYSKCGCTDLARRVFNEMTNRDVSTWSAMIVGLAMHGEAARALEMFKEMRFRGVAPNRVTLIGVLLACAHAGMVEEGRRHFEAMEEEYWVARAPQHYGILIDMYGRAGRIREAGEVAVEAVKVGAADAVVLGSLMGACEKHGEVAVGEWVAARMEEVEPGNDGIYVAMSNIYAKAGMWGEVERLRGWMRGRRVAKVPGCSLS
ncbi:Pentatricopeptide repeat-containing protein [Acorus gramineus]|uniref:Pentatricopeptide repeat-containing protein n=1 Tax=Acorus gramineus TaxID=55184 RepID=A0AAV9ARC6_ACOGR|nr:Pentatricopeptide repeat-containing protein [Acorus gramineus]